MQVMLHVLTFTYKNIITYLVFQNILLTCSTLNQVLHNFWVFVANSKVKHIVAFVFCG